MEEKTIPTRPKARTEGLVVRELPEEVLVYDLGTHKATCLNSTAARVWRLCDGRRTAAEIRRALEAVAEGRVPEELVWLALDQLGKDRLLDTRVRRPSELDGISRRELVKRIGLGVAITLPVVASIISPTPAQASVSCRANGQPCTFGTDCCSGTCDNGIGGTGLCIGA